MHYQRPNFPSVQACRHIAMGLAVLARHMENQPHVFQVQLDHVAVLPQETIAKLRDDFAHSAQSEDTTMRNEGSAFFYEDERHSIITALCALDEYRDHLGDALVAEEMGPLLRETSPEFLPRVTISKLALITLQISPTLKGKSPHQGENYDYEGLTWQRGGIYPDGHRRYRVIEEHPDEEERVLSSFDSLLEAEEALCRTCNHELDAYLMDGDEMFAAPEVGARANTEHGYGQSNAFTASR